MELFKEITDNIQKTSEPSEPKKQLCGCNINFKMGFFRVFQIAHHEYLSKFGFSVQFYTHWI